MCAGLLWSAHPLWRPNLLEYFPWMGVNGLVFVENTCLKKPEFSLTCFSISHWLQAIVPVRLHRNKALPFTTLSFFTLKSWWKWGQRFWCELLHLTSQPTFAVAYKELFFWITFLALSQNSVPAEHFHSINLLCLCSSSTIRYGTSVLRISNCNLVKKEKSTDWTMSAVLSIS